MPKVARDAKRGASAHPAHPARETPGGHAVSWQAADRPSEGKIF